jgi:predicted ATPase
MRIRIENIGPVNKIDLDLSKPFLVFTGLNGTGKTYISYIIYSLSAFFLFKKDILGWNEIIKSPSRKKTYEIDYPLLYDILRNHINTINSFLPYIFNVDGKDDIVRNARISLLTDIDEFKKSIYISHYALKAIDTFDFEKKGNTNKYTIKCIGGNTEEASFVNQLIIKCLFFGSIIEDIETSERSGLLIFNKELGRKPKDIDEDLSFGKSKINFPLPLAYLVENIGNLRKRFFQNSRYGFLADKIEKDVLKGHLVLNTEDEVWYSNKRMTDEIPLSLTSSGVKTICSIVLFLRHTAMDCNLMIIDEPEINLHPKNQILLARVFSMIVNSGIKLIINTHSDYIIREINNMIMLSSLKDKEKIKELGYSKDEVLEGDMVCPYYFEIQKNGADVIGKEIKVTKTGFSIDLIDEVINDQVETSQKIYEAMDI